MTRKNTKVTGNTIEINSTEVNPVCWQVIYQCDRLEAGKEVQPFSRNIYGQKVWARLTKYQEDKKEMMVLEVAALLKVEIPTENNKLITPKLTLEVIPSSLNSLTPTEEIAFRPPPGHDSRSRPSVCMGRGGPCFPTTIEAWTRPFLPFPSPLTGAPSCASENSCSTPLPEHAFPVQFGTSATPIINSPFPRLDAFGNLSLSFTISTVRECASHMEAWGRLLRMAQRMENGGKGGMDLDRRLRP